MQCKPGFLARRNNKQGDPGSSGEFERAFRGAVPAEYTLNTRFSETSSLCQAGRCIYGAADWMREIYDLPARAQSL